jgi:hypothetical protein
MHLLLVLLPLFTYLFFGLVFESAEWLAGLYGNDTSEIATWKALKYMLPVIPALGVLRGLLIRKTHKA